MKTIRQVWATTCASPQLLSCSLALNLPTSAFILVHRLPRVPTLHLHAHVDHVCVLMVQCIFDVSSIIFRLSMLAATTGGSDSGRQVGCPSFIHGASSKCSRAGTEMFFVRSCPRAARAARGHTGDAAASRVGTSRTTRHSTSTPLGALPYAVGISHLRRLGSWACIASF